MLNDRVQCLECGKWFKRVSNTHLKAYHDMTCQGYKEKHPGAPLFSEELAERHTLIIQEHYKTHSAWNKGLTTNPTKSNYDPRIGSMGEEGRNRLSKRMTEDNPMHRPGPHEKFLKKMKDPDLRERHRTAILDSWQDPNKYVNWAESLHLRPNKSEEILVQLIKEEDFPFVYNAEKRVGGKTPDFMHVTEMKVIELFGIRWHHRRYTISKKLIYSQTAEGCRKYYKRHGVKVLIIWDNELRNLDKIKNKIKKFVTGRAKPWNVFETNICAERNMVSEAKAHFAHKGHNGGEKC